MYFKSLKINVMKSLLNSMLISFCGLFIVLMVLTTCKKDVLQNSNEPPITPRDSGIIFNPDLTYGSVSDVDGNTYKTIQIGTQVWMAENLKTTKYNDGTAIPLFTDDMSWWLGLFTPGYGWYGYDSTAFKDLYGGLYNYTAATNGNLCPTGWHVSTDDEWTILTTFLGGEDIAGGKLKETDTIHWVSPNKGGNNESGFTALPGGYNRDGEYMKIGTWCFFWSVKGAYFRRLSASDTYAFRSGYSPGIGISVRCVKDAETPTPLATTCAATFINETGAALNGTVNANNQVTSVSFEYGTSKTYGQEINAIQGAVSGNINTSVSTVITGLVANTIYHYRLKAVSPGGTTFGKDMTFVTSGPVGDGIIFNPNLTYGSVNDIDGNTYKTIQIGTQTWMAENLKTTKYNDGSALSLITDKTTWANTSNPGYCWFDNDESSSRPTYGALYNWHAAKAGNLCPIGWHVSTNDEWTALTTLAGEGLKEYGTRHWNPPNTGASNESGFTALPGGYRDLHGTFGLIGKWGRWWTSTEKIAANNVAYGYCWALYYSLGIAKGNDYDDKHSGFSIRCVKDN